MVSPSMPSTTLTKASQATACQTKAVPCGRNGPRGSGGGIRTPDPAVNSRLLCRLSYSGIWKAMIMGSSAFPSRSSRRRPATASNRGHLPAGGAAGLSGLPAGAGPAPRPADGRGATTGPGGGRHLRTRAAFS